MKILWLYRYIKEYDFDNWLHMKFVEYIAKSQEMEIVAYGPDLNLVYGTVSPIEYNPEITLEQLCERFKPNVIVLNTKSRMFMHYNPHTEQAFDCWLPKDFTKFNKLPKVVIEEDYHYEKHDKWYQEVGINLILQRHYNSSLRQQNVPMIWFPFSVDTTIFKPNPEINRIRKIGFAGSLNAAYPERGMFKKIIEPHGLLDIFQCKEKIGSNYIEFLQSYLFVLSGISHFNITPAKMFEIMASGAIMLTNNDGHLNKLFNEDSFIVYDLKTKFFEKTMIDTIAHFITNPEKTKTITYNGVQCIRERHSHDVRIKELKVLLESICQKHGVH